MATYHISKHGSASDSNSGADATTNAWATITASVVKLSPGDILEVHVGTYAESVIPGGFGGISWVSGTSGSHITIRAFGHTETETMGVSAGTDVVVIRPTGDSHCMSFNKNDLKYLDFGGFVLDGVNQSTTQGVSTNNDINNCTFRNMEIKNTGADGFATSTSNGSATTARNLIIHWCYIHDCGTVDGGFDAHGIYIHTSGNIIEHNDIYNNQNAGIQIRDSVSQARSARNNIIRYNRIHGNNTDYSGSQNGINIHDRAQDNIIHNNLIYDHRNDGISLSSQSFGGSGNLIYNNTIVDNGTRGIDILWPSYTNTGVKNNIIYDNTSENFRNNGTSTDAVNNSIDGTNPNFNGYTAGSAWDLTLTGSTPSTILVGGADLGSDYYDDFAGETRSGTFSMGAYANEVAIPDPPLDPVVIYPTPLSVTKNVNKLLTEVQAQDNNDPDVGNYTLRLVLMGNGTLNDGV